MCSPDYIPDTPPHGAWAEVAWSDDSSEFAAVVSGLGEVDWVVVDHYAFDARWHADVQKQLGCLIAVVDDLADRPLYADILVDHNYAISHVKKYATLIGSQTTVLGGPRFAILGPKYSSSPKFEFTADVCSIGIFMGGVDADDWSSFALRACREVARFEGAIQIATTFENPNLPKLMRAVERDGLATILVDSPDLADFFLAHQLQIGAGGGAILERACIGVPTVAFACAENQLGVISELSALGVISTIDSVTKDSVAELGAKIAGLINDRGRRERLSRCARGLVDGRGAQRVALRMARSELMLRPAAALDSELAYRWRNHESTRRVSASATAISPEEHEHWFAGVLGGEDRHLFVANVGTLPVGFLRFDEQGSGVFEVSLYLDPDLHGLGLGSAMLRAGEARMADMTEMSLRITARVLDSNLVSRRMFVGAGYSATAGGLFAKVIRNQRLED